MGKKRGVQDLFEDKEKIIHKVILKQCFIGVFWQWLNNHNVRALNNPPPPPLFHVKVHLITLTMFNRGILAMGE